MSQKFRLVTRSDMDGIVSAILLKEIGLIDEIVFVHPKDMQDDKVMIDSNDITTNLPYVKGVHLAFDHHDSETVRNEKRENHIIDGKAPSAAHVVYDYYGGVERFPDLPSELMVAVDKADSAQFSKEDILSPKGWELLSFIMDPRTGLGRFKEYRISNYALMINLVDHCRNLTIDQILEHPDVKERLDILETCRYTFQEQIKRCTTVHRNLAVVDLTKEETIYPGNRFLIYDIFPDINISIHKMWGLKKQNVSFSVGKSIFNRTSKTDIGKLMLRYGGGGHHAAGACQIPTENAEETLQALIEVIVNDG